MNRASPYYDLRYRVDCKLPPNPATWWRTIAAFDSDRVALDYAAACRNAKPRSAGFEYRVMARMGRGWKEITRPL